MTTSEHLAKLAVVEAHLLRAMDELRVAVEALAETDAERFDHTPASHEITKAFLDLHRAQQNIHKEIRQ